MITLALIGLWLTSYVSLRLGHQFIVPPNNEVNYYIKSQFYEPPCHPERQHGLIHLVKAGSRQTLTGGAPSGWLPFQTGPKSGRPYCGHPYRGYLFRRSPTGGTLAGIMSNKRQSIIRITCNVLWTLSALEDKSPVAGVPHRDSMPTKGALAAGGSSSGVGLSSTE